MRFKLRASAASQVRSGLSLHLEKLPLKKGWKLEYA